MSSREDLGRSMEGVPQPAPSGREMSVEIIVADRSFTQSAGRISHNIKRHLPDESDETNRLRAYADAICSALDGVQQGQRLDPARVEEISSQVGGFVRELNEFDSVHRRAHLLIAARDALKLISDDIALRHVEDIAAKAALKSEVKGALDSVITFRYSDTFFDWEITDAAKYAEYVSKLRKAGVEDPHEYIESNYLVHLLATLERTGMPDQETLESLAARRQASYREEPQGFEDYTFTADDMRAEIVGMQARMNGRIALFYAARAGHGESSDRAEENLLSCLDHYARHLDLIEPGRTHPLRSIPIPRVDNPTLACGRRCLEVGRMIASHLETNAHDLVSDWLEVERVPPAKRRHPAAILEAMIQSTRQLLDNTRDHPELYREANQVMVQLVNGGMEQQKRFVDKDQETPDPVMTPVTSAAIRVRQAALLADTAAPRTLAPAVFQTLEGGFASPRAYSTFLKSLREVGIEDPKAFMHSYVPDTLERELAAERDSESPDIARCLSLSAGIGQFYEAEAAAIGSVESVGKAYWARTTQVELARESGSLQGLQLGRVRTFTGHMFGLSQLDAEGTSAVLRFIEEIGRLACDPNWDPDQNASIRGRPLYHEAVISKMLEAFGLFHEGRDSDREVARTHSSMLEQAQTALAGLVRHQLTALGQDVDLGPREASGERPQLVLKQLLYIALEDRAANLLENMDLRGVGRFRAAAREARAACNLRQEVMSGLAPKTMKGLGSVQAITAQARQDRGRVVDPEGGSWLQVQPFSSPLPFDRSNWPPSAGIAARNRVMAALEFLGSLWPGRSRD